MKKKYPDFRKTLKIFLIGCNILVLLWMLLLSLSATIHTGQSGSGLVILAAYPPLAIISIIDLIWLLYYILKYKPQGIKKTASNIALIILILLTYHLSTYFAGLPFIISSIKHELSKIPISYEKAASLINNCQIESLNKWHDPDKYENYTITTILHLKENENPNKYIAESEYDKLLTVAESAKTNCGSIKIADFTLRLGYQINKGHVYYNNYIIENASPASFVDLGDKFAKDANHVFFEDKTIPKLNPANCSSDNLSVCKTYIITPSPFPTFVVYPTSSEPLPTYHKLP